MNTLAMEPTYRVLLGAVTHFRILQVGCGGTGSALALALGGLAYHARPKGIRLELTLVDPDLIEAGNVGRQSFAAGSAAGGIPKCVDLAARLNAAYGLAVVAWPRPYSPALGRRWLDGGGASQLDLLVDCVDNSAARQAMAHTLQAPAGRGAGRLWQLSCGNERVNGQVLLGSTQQPEQIRFDDLVLCSGLPYPYLQEPGLLDEAADEGALSCAAMAQAEAQALMVNRLVAAVAGQMETEMVLQQQVTQMGAYFSLSPLAMRAVLLTRRAVQSSAKPD